MKQASQLSRGGTIFQSELITCHTSIILILLVFRLVIEAMQIGVAHDFLSRRAKTKPYLNCSSRASAHHYRVVDDDIWLVGTWSFAEDSWFYAHWWQRIRWPMERWAYQIYDDVDIVQQIKRARLYKCVMPPNVTCTMKHLSYVMRSTMLYYASNSCRDNTFGCWTAMGRLESTDSIPQPNRDGLPAVLKSH